MSDLKKTTAPGSSVGADEEQSFANKTTQSISDNFAESNGFSKNFEEMQKEMRRMMDPYYLRTVSMNELYDTVYKSKPPLIDGLLYPGIYLFVGAPKLGKSFSFFTR